MKIIRTKQKGYKVEMTAREAEEIYQHLAMKKAMGNLVPEIDPSTNSACSSPWK